MSSLTEIAKAWYSFIQQTPEIQELAQRRLAICDLCPSKVQIGSTGQLILNAINENSSMYKCGECHCPLAGKTAGEHSRCPLNKW